jgi:hypothetical protein
LAFNTLASVAATVDEVVVRQQWPWSTDVKVEYQISGIKTPVDIKVKVFDAGNELAEGVTNVKEMATGITETVAFEDVAAYFLGK